jgi:hypothetical protein
MVAEMERGFIRDRQRTGPAVLDHEKIVEARTAGKGATEIAGRLDVAGEREVSASTRIALDTAIGEGSDLGSLIDRNSMA